MLLFVAKQGLIAASITLVSYPQSLDGIWRDLSDSLHLLIRWAAGLAEQCPERGRMGTLLNLEAHPFSDTRLGL